VVVYQDVRGRGDPRVSSIFYNPATEGEDGYDTVEWLAERQWCDGQVATMGRATALPSSTRRLSRRI
jgi:predicted acyl esterase